MHGRYGEKGYHHWDILYPGYKYNMPDIQAAIGIQQLKKIEKFWKIRKEYTALYNEAFKKIPELITLTEKENIRHAYHLYVIIVKTESLKAGRDTIMNAIQAEGIGIGIHFRTIHIHPYYKRRFGFSKGDYPNAEYASERVISLPLYPRMEEKDVRRVIKIVKKIIEENSRMRGS